MNPTDPLAQLKDIHTPDPVAWWPLALGWWVVIFIGVVLLIALILWALKRKRQRRYVTQAQTELQALANSKLNTNEFIAAVNGILKRVALHRNRNYKIGTLSGQAWLAYLDQSLAKNSTAFREGCGRALGEAAYQPSPEVDHKAVTALAKRWISQHKIKNNVTPQEHAHV
jgi:hypothetical protein